MPFPFFGFGGSAEQPSNQGDNTPPTTTPPPPAHEDPSQQVPPSQHDQPSQYGQEDGWLTDEEAGVSSPPDVDIWSTFFGDDE